MERSSSFAQPHDYGTQRAFESLKSIRGKRVTVMGLGLHGGGLASARFFLKHGAFVTVTDMKSAEELESSVKALTEDSDLDSSRLRFVLGTHNIEDFKNADAVIKNPGVKYTGNPYLACARRIETDMSIFLQFNRARIIAVTGSKGKSSTVSAVHYGLNKAGIHSLLGGNITVSPLSFLDQTDEKALKSCGALPVVVLELSSWQLADLRGRSLLKPYIALISEIVPDHQNWYGSMENYVADKKLIYADQGPNDYTVCLDGPWGDVFASESRARVVRCPSGLPELLQSSWLDNLAVFGDHMKKNIQSAAAIMHLMGLKDDVTVSVLQSYTGIPHRLEAFFRTEKQGITCTVYNDSASTVPESCAAALQAFDKPLYLIAGGTDKDCDFTLLAGALIQAQCSGRLAALFLLAGSATDKLTALLNGQSGQNGQSGACGAIAAQGSGKKIAVPYFGPYDSLDEALIAVKKTVFTAGKTVAGAADVAVVFSPGAASFGMFKNEFERGNRFKETVCRLFA